MYLEEKREAEAPVVDSPERRVILGVIELLSEPGVWVGEPPNGRPGKHCINTAFNTQLRRLRTSDNATPIQAGHQAVAGVIGVLPHEVPGWNDAPGRTLDEVLTVLRKAAELV